MSTPTATIFLPYHALDDVILRGTRAAQPAASAVVPGTLYGVTDEGNALERSTGSAWEAYAPSGGGGGGAPAAHHATHEPGGADPLAVDAAAAVGSLRTLGTGATQAAPGNDARFTAPSTPTAHATTHQPGGADAMAVDAAAATGSLRTLGTGATQAAAGTDARLSDARAPTAHHATHEPGGTDALTALSADTLTSGTLPDARLSTNVPRLNAVNTFTAYQILNVGNPSIIWFDPSQPANSRAFGWLNSAQQMLLRALDDGLAMQTAPITVTRPGDVYVWRDFYEKQRTTALGHWITVPNNPGNFSAQPSGTLTVAAYFNQAYTLSGKTMTYAFYLQLTVGGTPLYLRISLPPGIVAATNSGTVFVFGSNTGLASVTPGDIWLNLYRDATGATNWVAGTYYMVGSIPFQIQ